MSSLPAFLSSYLYIFEHFLINKLTYSLKEKDRRRVSNLPPSNLTNKLPYVYDIGIKLSTLSTYYIHYIEIQGKKYLAFREKHKVMDLLGIDNRAKVQLIKGRVTIILYI